MKKIKIICLLLACVAIVGGVGVGSLASAENANFGTAKAALLLDAQSGAVVYEKNANEKRQIASMVKIMTLNILFDEINAGNLAYEDDVAVSDYATGMGGSQAFLDAHNSYKVSELIKSIIVASANDSCVAMAEHVSGDVGAFVQRMNDKAREWGMNDTYFVNCTGLPAANQYSCAKDVAVMLSRLIKNEKFFEFAKIWTFDFQHPSGRITTLTNTNKLVRFYNGCDGGKTGFTSEAKSCLAATAKRGDTRFICVVMGAENSKSRNGEVSKLFDYGFANYESRVFVHAGESFADEITVSDGKNDCTLGYAENELSAFVQKNKGGDCAVEKEYFTLKAPIKEGDVVGEVRLLKDGEIVAKTRILSKLTIKKKDYFDIIDEITDKW